MGGRVTVWGSLWIVAGETVTVVAGSERFNLGSNTTIPSLPVAAIAGAAITNINATISAAIVSTEMKRFMRNLLCLGSRLHHWLCSPC